jgi:hypothetical protein
LRDFLIFFAIQFIQYFLITVNLRAASQGLYFWTAFSDLLVAGNGFFLIQRVAKAEGKWALAGYTLGGAIGSVFAIWATKLVYGQ